MLVILVSLIGWGLTVVLKSRYHSEKYAAAGVRTMVSRSKARHPYH